jgi:hypothetical protein
MKYIYNIKVVLVTPLIFLFLCFSAYSQTTSPFDPPDEKLGTYVVNSGDDLDTGCWFPH